MRALPTFPRRRRRGPGAWGRVGSGEAPGAPSPPPPPTAGMRGFAGIPWTVATYMVAGEGSKDHHEARALAYLDPAAFAAIIAGIEAVTV